MGRWSPNHFLFSKTENGNWSQKEIQYLTNSSQFSQIFLYRSKQQKPEESVESEGKDGEDGNIAKASSSKPAKETSQAPTGEKSSAAKENAKKSQVDESEAKETTFVSPTEEEIKQLCEAPKAGPAKKKE